MPDELHIHIREDDTRRAAATMKYRAQQDDNWYIASILDGLQSGRPHQYVMALLNLFTDGVGPKFFTEEMVAAYGKIVDTYQQRETELRERGEWIDDEGGQ